MMMKRLTLIFLFLFLVAQAVTVSAQAIVGYIQSPASEYKVLEFKGSQSFIGFATGGNGGIISTDWVFCSSGCNPMTANTLTVPEVNFTEVGTYNVTFTVQDSALNTEVDSVLIDVKLAYIVDPKDNNSFWPSDELITFRGRGMHAEPNTFDYRWDFGDTDVNTNYLSQINEPNATVMYDVGGNYRISLRVRAEMTGEFHIDYRNITVVESLEPTLNCTTRYLNCDVGEIELLKLYKATNTHAVSPSQASATYNYKLCCETNALEVEVGTSETSSTFIVLTDDLDAATGGSQKTDLTIDPAGQVLEFTSYLGAGTRCQTENIGANGNCSTGLECIYEFYPGPGSTSHISNCTESWELNTYGVGTWAMCCEIAEICSNNADDDLNLWFDCVDNDVCSESGNYQPCGLSDNFKHDPTCSWLSSECDSVTGECDFTNYSEAYWDTFFNTFVYKLPYPGFESCELIRIAGTWQVQGVCPPGVDENNITLPLTTDPAVINVNTLYLPQGLNTDRYELYAKCRSFYCSVGEDPNNPLPPILPNMTQNHTQTRHCCPNYQYWDPVENDCADFDFCYASDLSEACLTDFDTDLLGWADDVYGATNPNPSHTPQDCVLDYDIAVGITSNVLCCPVWSGGLNIHDYVDITYYIQE